MNDDDRMATVRAGGLRIPGPLGISQQQHVHDYWRTYDQAEQKLKDAGLPVLEKPRFAYPGSVTPEQLTTKDNHAYSSLYAEHLGWYNYTAEIVSGIRAMLLQIKNEMEDLEVELRSRYKRQNKDLPSKEKHTEKDIDDLIHLDERHKKLAHAQQEYEQSRLLFEAKLDAMSRNLRVVSRQVEIRRGELDAERLGNGLPGRPVFPRP